jgi:alcohol dehydrogenase (NADP+)
MSSGSKRPHAPADSQATRREALSKALQLGAVAAVAPGVAGRLTDDLGRAERAAGGDALKPCRAYGSPMMRAPLAPIQIDRREPDALDVEIDVLHCGVCHSDVHAVNNDWKNTLYPCVPGHEIVGRVARVGAGVKTVREGDVVAVGAMVDSCGSCAACQKGLEPYCQGPKGATATYNGPNKPDGTNTHGGYSTHIVVKERFVLAVPSSLQSNLQSIPPLLCAGITTFSPLRRWNVKEGTKVAVAGMGGLGHLGVKFAKAMGAQVTVFSTSPEKEGDARKCGASDFVDVSDVKKMRDHELKYDVVLNTIPYDHDVNAYTALVAQDGTHVIVGLLLPFVCDNTKLVFHRRSVSGSNTGGIPETKEMLEFCAKHDITAIVETIPANALNDAYAKVLAKKARYRYVVDVAGSMLQK